MNASQYVKLAEMAIAFLQMNANVTKALKREDSLTCACQFALIARMVFVWHRSVVHVQWDTGRAMEYVSRSAMEIVLLKNV